MLIVFLKVKNSTIASPNMTAILVPLIRLNQMVHSVLTLGRATIGSSHLLNVNLGEEQAARYADCGEGEDFIVDVFFEVDVLGISGQYNDKVEDKL